MTDPIQNTLSERFGFEVFRPGQREVIENLVAGRSSAAVFPTGGGKSMCYQLPALLLPGLTLVVSPLIALMKDQIDALLAKDVPAARLDSTLTVDEYRDVTRRLRGGELKLLYVSPERFTNERFRGLLSEVNVSLFAVDEAHCISEWGHNFRPDYLKLARFANECNADAVLALTATATPQVLVDICRFFTIETECAVQTPFYRSNLTLLSEVVDEQTRDEVLISKLKDQPPGPTIVYVTLQRTAGEVAVRLAEAGLSAKAYHAGMKADERADRQDWFMSSDDAIIVATIAFGMGIDKSNIRYVYHYNLPKSLENYSQEIGRAGRDGETSICEMLFCATDLNTLENFIFGDTPERDSVAGLVETMLESDDEIAISQIALAKRVDMRPLVMRTLITYLEIDGWIQETTPIYSQYQFIPLQPSEQILSNFDDKRRQFLLTVFKQVTKAKKWCTVDIDQAARETGSDRMRVVKAFDYLAEKGMIELKPGGLMHRYRRLKRPDDSAAVIDDLCDRMKRREKRDLERLGDVIDQATGEGCQVSRLGAYFGEPLESGCGHCSRCLEETTSSTEVVRPQPEMTDALWDQAKQLRDQHADILDSPSRLARFLCGITSPKLTRAKLTKNPLFGAFEKVSYRQVLERADQLITGE
ncbi:MAG: RecQ family ATP-dependent DNA helicase [Planctomycetales bacterium]|jgi:ATP-dependent DNA helicase RecQ